jgi:hypothetical protein
MIRKRKTVGANHFVEMIRKILISLTDSDS